MPNGLTFAVLAGLSLGGTALGIELGHSAIAEINPAYMQEPETSFHADLVAYRSPDWAQVQAKEFDQATSAPITQCMGCLNAPPPPFPVEYVPAHDPYVDLAVAGGPERPRKAPRAAPAAEEAQVVYVEAAPDPARERIVRYSSYPVTQEEARAMQAPPPDEPADEDFAATQ